MNANALTDPAFVLYAVTSITAGFGFIVFFWWWSKQNFHASAVYIYVMILLFGIWYADAFNAIVRYYRFVDECMYDILLGSKLWAWRKIFCTISVALIVIHLTVRLIKSYCPRGKKDAVDSE